jgi:hypothetical protein
VFSVRSSLRLVIGWPIYKYTNDVLKHHNTIQKGDICAAEQHGIMRLDRVYKIVSAQVLEEDVNLETNVSVRTRECIGAR